MGETSLLIFTLCLQAAIGIMLFITIAKQLYKGKDFKKAGYIAAGLSVIGVIASLSHLGQPMSFLNSLSNLGSSWLSNEALLSGFFMGIAVLYALAQYFKPDNESLNKVLRWAGSILGIITVFAMAKVYTTTVVPVWQGINTMVDFYATTIATGALVFIISSLKELEEADKRIYGFVILGAVILQAAVAVPHALGLAQQGMAGQSSAAILSSMSFVVGIKWLLLLSGAALLIWTDSKKSSSQASASAVGLIYAAFAFLVVGQVIGRYIFYAAQVAITVGLS